MSQVPGATRPPVPIERDPEAGVDPHRGGRPGDTHHTNLSELPGRDEQTQAGWRDGRQLRQGQGAFRPDLALGFDRVPFSTVVEAVPLAMTIRGALSSPASVNAPPPVMAIGPDGRDAAGIGQRERAAGVDRDRAGIAVQQARGLHAPAGEQRHDALRVDKAREDQRPGGSDANGSGRADDAARGGHVAGIRDRDARLPADEASDVQRPVIGDPDRARLADDCSGTDIAPVSATVTPV